MEDVMEKIKIKSLENMEKEIRILDFAYNRMVEKHGENPNFDYMHHFKDILDEMKHQKKVKESWNKYKPKLIAECGKNSFSGKPLIDSDEVQKQKIKWEAIKEIIIIVCFFISVVSVVFKLVRV